MSHSTVKLQFARAGIVFVLAGVSLLAVAPSLSAKDPVYDRGTLLSMDSQACGSTEVGGKSVAGEILGTDSGKKTTQQILCQDYVLQSDRIVYHIRLKDAKHPILLPVGDAVEFRIEKSSLFLRDPESGQKEREYIVVSMTPRTDAKDTHTTTAEQQQ
ncbi:MAG: hypothetical protein WBF06_12000 [Candidatus Acidiferrales bacterium]